MKLDLHCTMVSVEQHLNVESLVGLAEPSPRELDHQVAMLLLLLLLAWTTMTVQVVPVEAVVAVSFVRCDPVVLDDDAVAVPDAIGKGEKKKS